MTTSGATHRTAPATRRRGTLLALVVAVLLLGVQSISSLPAGAAETAPVTYQGPTYPSASGPPSADKPQSKLWFAAGAWWGLLRTASGHTVHRLENHGWRDTGTVVDERLASTGDALWDGSRLYVASRVASGALRVVRLSYDSSTDTFSRDFVKQIASHGTESITIAKDSVGRLWVAYTWQSRVYVAHSTTSDTTWTSPFLVPVPDNTVTSDDIAAVLAFNGSIGVMYSDQGDGVMRFAVHHDGAPTDVWTMEDALAGPGLADDHINLKSLLQDDAGRIYAAVKTSVEGSTDPSIVVLQRTSAGVWSHATAAQERDGLTRAQLALDSTGRRVVVIMADEGAGPTVYYKTAGLGALSFTTGRGQPLITWPGALLNDPSTTKQAVDASTGLVVLASDDKSATRRYYHAELSLGSNGPVADQTAPSVPTGLTGSATSATSVQLSWGASTDDTGVTGYDVLRDGAPLATSASTSYTDSAATAGTTYTYRVRARDAAGNVSAASGGVAVTTSPAPASEQTVTLTAVQDSYVTSGSPGRNYGRSSLLAVDGSPAKIAYLKFDAAPYAGRTVTGARLQVRVTTSGSVGQQAVKLVNDDSWTESGITFANAPARGTVMGTLGATTPSTTVSVPLSALQVQGQVGGPLSLALDSSHSDGLDLGSRHTSTPPTLVLTFAAD